MSANQSHPTREDLAGFRQRQLSPERALDLDRHLRACAECRAAFQRDLSSHGLHAALASALLRDDDAQCAHLSYEELASFVDGGLSAAERQDLEEHLELCETCRRSREDLDALAAAYRKAAPGGRRRAAVWAAVTTVAAAAAFLLIWRRDRPPGRDDLHPSAVASPAPTSRTAAQDADLAGLPPALRAQVKAALREGRLERPAVLARLVSEPVTLLGAPSPPPRFSLAVPLGTMVREERPAFRWHPLPGADDYEVRVYDADYHEVLASGPITSSYWVPAKPLDRGRLFSWVVTARWDGARILSPAPPAAEARFGVLGGSELILLTDAEHGAPQSHAALGVVCASLGLLDEAEAHLAAASEADPGSPKVPDLLRRVRAWRRSG
jgi:hypothetical protein